MPQARSQDEPYSHHGAPNVVAIKKEPPSIAQFDEDTQGNAVAGSGGLADTSKTAWKQVFASFLINMNLYGLVQSFGEFQHFYETEYLENYSSSTISWIGTVQGALMLLVGAVAGPIFDKGYFKVTLRCATLGLVVSWMLLSVSDRYYQIMLTQGILAGICTGLMEVPSVALIPDYFRKRLGLALGLAISGAPAGGIIYSAVFRATLTAAGFGWATRAIGFIVLVTLGVAISIIKPKDADRKAKPRRFFELGAFRDKYFLLMFFYAFFCNCAALVPNFITPAFAVALGKTSDTSSYLLVVLNGAQFFGRVLPNWLSDYIGGGDMLLAAQLIIGILGLSWITINTFGGFVEFLVFVGFLSGAVPTLASNTIPYICPSDETLGTRIGMIYAAAGLGVLIGNPIALATVGDRHLTSRRDFLGAQLWMGVCALIAAGLFVLPSRSARHNRKEVFGGLNAT